MSNIIDTLESRGLIESTTSNDLKDFLSKPVNLYCGFDPTAESLHLGNLAGIVMLGWFQRHGHTPVALIGGATGMVGDPSGKSVERPLLDEASIQRNIEGIRKNLTTTIDFERALLVNNYDWYANFGFVEFLREVGKYFRMGPMLGKEMVRTRLESQEGLSYTEFSYQILQAYDFVHLYDDRDVVLQIGGSDQWGNITSGVELVRRMRDATVHGLTFPLITRSDGKKFGKSEGGAIWLSEDKLSPYDFYQYLYRTPDADVIRLMYTLTFMEVGEIREWERRMQAVDYQVNSAQKKLAEAVTELVHGDEGLVSAVDATARMAPGSHVTELSAESLEAATDQLPVVEVEAADAKVIDLLVAGNMAKSKGEARRLVRNGGIYLNNEKLEDEERTITQNNLIGGKFVLIGVGKKRKLIVRVTN